MPSPATCWRCGSSTSYRARARNPNIRPRVRLLGRGLVGLSLQRVSRRSEAARGRHHLRDLRRTTECAACARAVFTIAGSRRPTPSASCIPTYDYPGVPVARHGEAPPRACSKASHPPAPHFGVIAVAPREVDFDRLDAAVLFRRQSRQLALGEGGGRLSSGLAFPAHCSRSAIPMPRKATAN